MGSVAQAPVDDSYTPCTDTVAHYVVDLPPTLFQRNDLENRRLVLVDTPGFDHMSFNDAEILRRIAVWLAASFVPSFLSLIYLRLIICIGRYGSGVKVAGVVYMHAIVPERMTEGNASGLEIFRQLCGEESLPGVILATTWWELCHTELGTSREGELRNEVWQQFLSGPQRAAVVRLENTPGSALNLVKEIVDKMPNPDISAGGRVLRLQHQIVDRKKAYDKTDAGLAAKPRSESRLANAARIFRSWIRGF